MIRLPSPAEWVAVIRDKFSKSMRIAKQFRLPTAWVAVTRRMISKAMRLDTRYLLLAGSVVVVLCAALLMTSTPVTGAQEITRTWEGTWSNDKSSSSGPLRCVATEVESGQWNGTFTGIFKEEPFTYQVTFQSQQEHRGSFGLSGKAMLRDNAYEWSGSMWGKTLSGTYGSTDGSQGEFILTEK
jgi:hypothetical protein